MSQNIFTPNSVRLPSVNDLQNFRSFSPSHNYQPAGGHNHIDSQYYRVPSHHINHQLSSGQAYSTKQNELDKRNESTSIGNGSHENFPRLPHSSSYRAPRDILPPELEPPRYTSSRYSPSTTTQIEDDEVDRDIMNGLHSLNTQHISVKRRNDGIQDDRETSKKIKKSVSSQGLRKKAIDISAPPKKRGGRQPGSSQYTTAECMILLESVDSIVPIGGKSWENVSAIYNARAVDEGFSERENQAIKAKYNNLVNQAKIKPTGDPERKQMYLFALSVEDKINAKAGGGDLHDSDLEEVDVPPSRKTVKHSAGEIIDISDGDEIDIAEKKMAHGKGKDKVKVKKEPDSGTVLTKAYRVENSQPTKRFDRQGAAHKIISTLEGAFDPRAQLAREEQRTTSTMQLAQFTALNADLRDLRSQLNTMQGLVAAETRRADTAELELRLHNQLSRRHPRRRHGRRRSPSFSDDQSDALSSSPLASRYRSHRNHRHRNHRSRTRSASPPMRKQKPFVDIAIKKPTSHVSDFKMLSPTQPVSPSPNFRMSSPELDPVGASHVVPDTLPASRIASGSNITTDMLDEIDPLTTLANLAANLAGPGNAVIVTPHKDGYVDVQISPSRRG